MRNRQVKRSDTGKIQKTDIKNIYGESMCQYLPIGNFVEFEVTGRKEDLLFKTYLDTKDDHEQA